MITQKYINELSFKIIGFAIEIHKEIGPGLLESVYEKCMFHLLTLNGYEVQRQQSVPLEFHGLYLDCEQRFDLLVNNLIIVELKTVDTILTIHEAQLLTYQKLMKKPEGVLINFNCSKISSEGKKTIVTELFQTYPIDY